jgi:hypothetical protein
MAENINDLKPSQINNTLAMLFETSRENGDQEALQLAINTAETVKIEPFQVYQRAVFYYNLANGYSYLQQARGDETNPVFEAPGLDKQIYYSRLALGYVRQTDKIPKHCEILTNLCILFNHIGRFPDAIGYINEARKLDPKFGMAIGHKGMALFYSARYLWEPAHQFLYFQAARKFLLIAANSSDVYPDVQGEFRRLVAKIESVHDIKTLNKAVKQKSFFFWLRLREKRYRKWCLSNRLFLNPLNDLLEESVAAHDYFFLPSMRTPLFSKPVFHSMYNQLKQEYSSARYFYYQGIREASSRFADKGVVLMETNESAEYGIALERMKIAFRMCYSIFDKIGWFIDQYYELKLPSRRLSFRNVWYKDCDTKLGLHEVFKKSVNWPLRGLFWISKDLADKDLDSPIEPEASKVSLMRNAMEHKYFKVVDGGDFDGENETGEYIIDRLLFESKVLRSLELVRSAIQALAFVVYHEESYRDHKHPVFDMPFVEVPDKKKR